MPRFGAPRLPVSPVSECSAPRHEENLEIVEPFALSLWGASIEDAPHYEGISKPLHRACVCPLVARIGRILAVHIGDQHAVDPDANQTVAFQGAGLLSLFDRGVVPE